MGSDQDFASDDAEHESDEDDASGWPSFSKVVEGIVRLDPKRRPAAKDVFLERLNSDPSLTRSALVVGGILLRELMWSTGTTEKLGFADIAQRCRISRCSAKRGVKLLEAKHYVIVQRSKITATQNAINRYTLPPLLW